MLRFVRAAEADADARRAETTWCTSRLGVGRGDSSLEFSDGDYGGAGGVFAGDREYGGAEAGGGFADDCGEVCGHFA